LWFRFRYTAVSESKRDAPGLATLFPFSVVFDNHDPFSINAHTQRHKKLIGGDFTAVVSPFKIKWFSID